jgi:hypothetical protein
MNLQGFGDEQRPRYCKTWVPIAEQSMFRHPEKSVHYKQVTSSRINTMTQLRTFHFLLLFLSICGFATPAVAGNYDTSQVFTMTNAASGNEILIFTHHRSKG